MFKWFIPIFARIGETTLNKVYVCVYLYGKCSPLCFWCGFCFSTLRNTIPHVSNEKRRAYSACINIFLLLCVWNLCKIAHGKTVFVSPECFQDKAFAQRHQPNTHQWHQSLPWWRHQYTFFFTYREGSNTISTLCWVYVYTGDLTCIRTIVAFD